MADVSSPIAVATDGIFTQVTAGYESSYGLRADGAVFSWGDNTYGQLGDNSQTQRDTPVSVVGGHRFDYIAAGWSHMLGLKADGSLFGWGDNSTGQLGDGTSVPSSASSPQSIVGDHEFTKVDAGECHSVGLKADGSVWTWGCNTENQLGYETLVGAIGGYSHGGGCAIDQNGVLWSWGNNSFAGNLGILGDGTHTDRSSPVSVLNTGGKPWMNITPGPSWQEGQDWDRHPCNTPGNCRGTAHWGDNQAWAIKDEFTGYEDTVPDHPDFYTSLWMWGAQTAGNLGHGNWNVSYSSPVSVINSGIRGFWTAATGAGNTTCALDHRGQLWCWGIVGQYPLGFSPYNSTPLNSFNSPTEIAPKVKEQNPDGYVPSGLFDPFYANSYGHLRMGSNAGLVIDGGGRVFLWGASDSCKQCRGGSPYNDCGGNNYPRLMSEGIWPGAWRDADMGEAHSIYMTTQGNVYMCGYNHPTHAMSHIGCNPATNCWFGLGGPTNRSTPTIIKGSPHSAIKVMSGSQSATHGFLREDGSLWMWGENNNGECGTGDTVARSSPTSVLGSGNLYNFVDFVIHGESGTTAIDDEGQVWGWGAWQDIGANSTTNQTSPVRTSLPAITPEGFRSSPTRVGTEATGPFFIDIAVGDNHNLALQADGSAWAWGKGTEGQLGTNDVLNQGFPTSVIGGHSFIDIAAGTSFSYALKEDESVFAWGDNTCGKLGDGTTTDRSSPVSITF